MNVWYAGWGTCKPVSGHMDRQLTLLNLPLVHYCVCTTSGTRQQLCFGAPHIFPYLDTIFLTKSKIPLGLFPYLDTIFFD